MMKKLLPVLVVMASGVAHADMMAPATLDLSCKDKSGKEIARIVSEKNGSAVSINGKVYPGKQIIAGTEGGPAYAQAVNNQGGYNITLSGGDFSKAFDDRIEIKSGQTTGAIQFFGQVNRSIITICVGLISFK